MERTDGHATHKWLSAEMSFGPQKQGENCPVSRTTEARMTSVRVGDPKHGCGGGRCPACERLRASSGSEDSCQACCSLLGFLETKCCCGRWVLGRCGRDRPCKALQPQQDELLPFAVSPTELWSWRIGCVGGWGEPQICGACRLRPKGREPRTLIPEPGVEEGGCACGIYFE